ncbi:ATP-binding protein [Caulobacter soli]|uniref:ATP-binding protein n=1 Tax=Caulobacter soli TaxID=2708539 RepID=UPI0013EC1EB8|nr:winged helix-turn-helix domain-containing protein [Caulobacter soli]
MTKVVTLETPFAQADGQAFAAAAGEKVYSFGDYRLIPQRQLLLRGAFPVRIGTRALDLLQLLVERQGELVSKEQLIGFAWPGTFVHESNLKVNIASLRRALPQARSELPYIVTVPGRGYRFVAPVRIDLEQKPPVIASPVGLDNLPPPHDLFGREEDIAELSARLVSTGFLTIVGPAGVGKTSVAVAVARHVADQFDDGACFVDLAAIGDARLVCPAIASSLGAGGNLSDMLSGIVEALRGQRRLLILDNCEHVLAATCMVADHIRSVLPDIGVLATSREPLRSQFETVHLLAPLRCPLAERRLDRDEALAYSAIALFVTRANAATGFTPTDADIPAIVDICRRLDGIALAIELAAPRLASRDPATLLHLLEQSFELLNYGPRNAPARHQTLLATLDWSYRLLSDREAAVLRLLSVFAGRFCLDDVLALGLPLDIPTDDVARCVGNLATKSLLSTNISDGKVQYRLLDATRTYAAERLRQAGEEPAALASHAAFLLRVFERAEQEWHWRLVEDWTAAYAPRINDLRKAIDWAFGAQGSPALGLWLTAAAIPLWDELSLVGESRLRVRRALRVAESHGDGDPGLRMKLILAYAWSLTFAERLPPEGDEAWREGLALAQATGSIDYQLRALWGLAVLQSFTGRHRQALVTLEAFEEVIQGESDRSAAPDGERLRAMTAFYCGQVDAAYETFVRLAREHATVSHRSRIARFQLDRYVAIRNSLATVAWVRGEAVLASEAAAAAVAGALSTGHVVSHSNALALAALPVTLWNGELEAAQAHLETLIDNFNHRDIGIWGPVSRFFGGAIQHARGDEGGVDAMVAALDELLASNFLLRAPIYASMLVQAALDQGRLDVARGAADTALALVQAQEEAWCLSEVLRVRGLVEQRDGATEHAEQTLERAIASAASIGAHVFELRAAASLAELWTQLGRVSSAVTLLEETCGRLAFAHASRDHVQARKLLDRLRRPRIVTR